MNETDDIGLSKFLSYVLRHRPEAIGIQLDQEGWTSLDDLMRLGAAERPNLCRAGVERVVAGSDKQRFQLSADGTRIRAVHGHSAVVVDRDLPRLVPPEVLYHGTPEVALSSIMTSGLSRQRRHFVHLTDDPVTALQVGRRRGPAVLLRVLAKKMHDEGHTFHRSESGVWLVAHVSPEYLERSDFVCS
jgi:putative RNA 2'-phosphotransferase